MVSWANGSSRINDKFYAKGVGDIWNFLYDNAFGTYSLLPREDHQHLCVHIFRELNVRADELANPGRALEEGAHLRRELCVVVAPGVGSGTDPSADSGGDPRDRKPRARSRRASSARGLESRWCGDCARGRASR